MEKIENNKPIKLSKSCIGETEKRSVMKVLDHGYLGMGGEVRLFEEALTEFFGRTTVCVVNGTAALHLALEAIGIGAGDEVLVQSLTYAASFQAISATGATPVACDVDPVTLCLDWKDAESRITARTKAIMPVHYAGGVGELDEIYEFSKKYSLRVIEDAAHAFGTEYNGKKVGGFGDIACFSFDGIKNITSGEGGCIVSEDKEILQKVRDARLLGVEKDTEKRYSGQRSWGFDIKAQGWRYHMSNIMAAIGNTQLERFSELASKRRELAKFYNIRLSEISGLKIPLHDYDKVVPHIYVVRLDSKINRDNIRKKLSELNIETGIHYQPNHLLSMYFNSHDRKLPVVDSIYPQLLSLPLHPHLEEGDINRVSDELIKCVTNIR